MHGEIAASPQGAQLHCWVVARTYVLQRNDLGRRGSGSDSHGELVRRVKRLQRENESQRVLWWQWCEANGQGVRDPRRHVPKFISDFFHALAANAIPDVPVKCGAGIASVGADASNSLGFTSGVHLGFSGQLIGSEAQVPIRPTAVAGAAIGDSTHEELVARVKDGQRQSLDWKRRWWRYCDQNGSGVRDPRRHEPAFIFQFLQQVNEATQLQLSVQAFPITAGAVPLGHLGVQSLHPGEG